MLPERRAPALISRTPCVGCRCGAAGACSGKADRRRKKAAAQQQQAAAAAAVQQSGMVRLSDGSLYRCVRQGAPPVLLLCCASLRRQQAALVMCLHSLHLPPARRVRAPTPPPRDAATWDTHRPATMPTRPVRRPAGSRVVLDETAGRLDIDIPPQPLGSANIGTGLFALAWNAFVAFWTVRRWMGARRCWRHTHACVRLGQLAMP
jgi:hypothetical protein